MTAYQDYPTGTAAADTVLLAEQGDQTLERVPYPFGYATSADIAAHDGDAAAHPAIQATVSAAQSDATAAQGDATTALARVPPAGGTIGQLLAKLSGTDYDYEWVDPAAGGGDVASVNGQTGVVVLDADDLDDAATVNKFTTAAEQAKLAGIEDNATADQTGAEIKALYEAEADTNAYTDAEKSKLAGIEAAATADQTGAEIKTAYEAEADTNAYTDTEKSKLAGIEANATNTLVDVVSGQTAVDIWRGTQAAYDAIGTKDANTLYFVTA